MLQSKYLFDLTPEKITKTLLKKLSDINSCSREKIIRQYDHEVLAQTVIKPLSGIKSDGPQDACVIKPVSDSFKGVAVSNGINLYGKHDTYRMTLAAIDEALRNIAAVGGDIDKTALLDNFCWGSLDTPEEFGGIMRAMEACYDAAKAYSAPFISGKDSLNNKFVLKNRQVKSITPVLLISAVSIVGDIRKCVTMDLKELGNPLYIAGKTGADFPPVTNPAESLKTMKRLKKAIFDGLVASCHDCSEGGLACAVSEMCFSGGLGAELYLSDVPVEKNVSDDSAVLFSESTGRFIIEVKAGKEKSIEKIFRGSAFSKIGTVTRAARLRVFGKKSTQLIDANIAELKAAWQAPDVGL